MKWIRKNNFLKGFSHQISFLSKGYEVVSQEKHREVLCSLTEVLNVIFVFFTDVNAINILNASSAL
jgi:hypothetical protein